VLPENSCVCFRCEREERLEILKEEPAFGKHELEVTVFEGFGKWPPEDGEQDLAVETAGRRMPVDIEVGGVGRLRSMLEHIHPPGIFAARGHMVGHNVQHQAHSSILQLGL